jgi:hypothetical protein
LFERADEEAIETLLIGAGTMLIGAATLLIEARTLLIGAGTLLLLMGTLTLVIENQKFLCLERMSTTREANQTHLYQMMIKRHIMLAEGIITPQRLMAQHIVNKKIENEATVLIQHLYAQLQQYQTEINDLQ